MIARGALLAASLLLLAACDKPVNDSSDLAAGPATESGNALMRSAEAAAADAQARSAPAPNALQSVESANTTNATTTGDKR